MRFNHAALLLCLALPFSIAARATSLPTEAQAVVRAYADSYEKNDCAAVLRLSSPALTTRLNARGETANFCSALAEMANLGLRLHVREPTALRVDGGYRVAVIPVTRTPSKPNAYASESAYVLHSSDHGKSWYILDLGCTDSRWLQEIYPAYDGDPPLPEPRHWLPQK